MIIKRNLESMNLDNYLQPSSFDVRACSDKLDHLKYQVKVLLKFKKNILNSVFQQFLCNSCFSWEIMNYKFV
jgi:hypothetical protein